jgi:hypothetical protein
VRAARKSFDRSSGWRLTILASTRTAEIRAGSSLYKPRVLHITLSLHKALIHSWQLSWSKPLRQVPADSNPEALLLYHSAGHFTYFLCRNVSCEIPGETMSGSVRCLCEKWSCRKGIIIIWWWFWCKFPDAAVSNITVNKLRHIRALLDTYT